VVRLPVAEAEGVLAGWRAELGEVERAAPARVRWGKAHE
jgi:hypothetical protein